MIYKLNYKENKDQVLLETGAPEKTVQYQWYILNHEEGPGVEVDRLVEKLKSMNWEAVIVNPPNIWP